QALLTEIAAQKPDVVFAFFAGGGAVKFVKDYDAAGLRRTIPLVGSGFLTDGTLEAQGASAQGLITALHYGDNIETARNGGFPQSWRGCRRPRRSWARTRLFSGPGVCPTSAQPHLRLRLHEQDAARAFRPEIHGASGGARGLG
ncbi:MAG: ABC transporter substrate-binding protein, partial [Rubrivivax sp.]